MNIRYIKDHNGKPAGHKEDVADAAGHYLVRVGVAVVDDAEDAEKVEHLDEEKEKKEVTPSRKKIIKR